MVCMYMCVRVMYPIEPPQKINVLHAEHIDSKQCRDEVVEQQSRPEGPGYPEHRAHDDHVPSRRRNSRLVSLQARTRTLHTPLQAMGRRLLDWKVSRWRGEPRDGDQPHKPRLKRSAFMVEAHAQISSKLRMRERTRHHLELYSMIDDRDTSTDHYTSTRSWFIKGK